MQNKSFLFTFAFSMLPLGAPAALLVDVNLENGYITNASIAGQSGTGDPGLSGTWAVISNTNYDVTVKTGGLTYAAADGSYTINGGSNSLEVKQTLAPGYGGTGSSLTNISLSAPVTGKNVFVGTLLKRSGNNTLATSFALGFFASDASTENVFGPGLGLAGSAISSQKPILLAGDNSTNFAQFESSTRSPGVLWSDVDSDATFFMVAEYIWSEADKAYTSVKFWLNPAQDGNTTGALFYAAYDLKNNFTSISCIGLSVANWQAGNAFTFDAFRIGENWEDLVPQSSVPEPGVAALYLGLATLFAVALRRAGVHGAKA
ncbi:MAG: hypothetical protein LBK99_19050 [Opitutaceae bacterium]|jgi:hypothetical protein|nr:hypothetical protein [Opitutaceae bacterium]